MQGAANPQNHNGASVSSMVSSLLQWVARPHCPNGSNGGCPQWLRPPNDRNGCPSDGSPQNPLKTRHWTTRARSWLFLLNIDMTNPEPSQNCLWNLPTWSLPSATSRTFVGIFPGSWSGTFSGIFPKSNCSSPKGVVIAYFSSERA